jgi:N-methylhydantoinase A/oxoprolinase/acetone carboxylase beta subunit
MRDRQVLASCKSPTTANISDGIREAVASVLNDGNIDVADIDAVMIGTTQFTNAFVERRSLQQVAVIRIALPAARGVPPLIDWPEQILAAVGNHSYQIRGGYQFDGREIAALDEKTLQEAAQSIRSKGINSIALTGLFSPLNAAVEQRAAEILRQEIPDADITLSSDIGQIGLLERENAAVMNASLANFARQVVSAFRAALQDLQVQAPFFISQNDGTLMSAERVERYPVLTFASGPTNSMRGAAYLSGLENALVADIGGTTTDIGMLLNGFPRESSVTVDIGGVRTNFRMPDVLALGLGGGSIVSDIDGEPHIGPRSVGFQLLEKAKIFGGDVLTASDIAVACGSASFGEPANIKELSTDFVERAVTRMHNMLADGVDRMKTSADALPLILVGGGAVLISREIDGVSDIIVPENCGVANAIGASIAQVSGEVDTVYSYDTIGRDNALAEAKAEASRQAVAAGADEATLKQLYLEELPLAYGPAGAVRVRVKIAGELASTGPKGDNL